MDPCSLIVFSLLVAVAHGAAWSYHGDHGPSHWKDMEGQATCGGERQSPIDFTPDVLEQAMTLGSFDLVHFDTTAGIKWLLINNGHTVQINVQYADPLVNAINVSAGGLPGIFKVAQFHFHWGSDSSKGSEHVVDGKSYPMEVHIVTYNTKYPNITEAAKNADGLAVLGFFYEIQADDNPTITTLVSQFPSIVEALSDVEVTPFALNDMVPDLTNYYRYDGSLTIPGCNEVVIWTVFTETIKLSEAQMAAFRSLKESETEMIVDNYRPPQALNSRKVQTSFVPSASSATAVVFSASATLCSLFVSVFGRL